LVLEEVLFDEELPDNESNDSDSCNDHDDPEFHLIVPDPAGWTHLLVLPQQTMGLPCAKRAPIETGFAVVVERVVIVFVGTGVDAFLGGRDGEAGAFLHAGVSSQEVPRAAGQALVHRLAETFVAVAVAGLGCDQDVLDAPALDDGVVLGCERGPFQVNV